MAGLAAIPGRHRTGSRPSTSHDVHICGFPRPRPMACPTAGLGSARRFVSTASGSYWHPPFRGNRFHAPGLEENPGWRFGCRPRMAQAPPCLLNRGLCCENETSSAAPDPGSYQRYGPGAWMSREDRGTADGSGSAGLLRAARVCPGSGHGHGRGPGRGPDIEAAGIRAWLLPPRGRAGWRGAPGCSG